MLKNYLKVAIRTLLRHKFFSTLNILGLALGMACSLLILLWVKDEKGITVFRADGRTNGNRLFVVYQRQYFDNKVEGLYATTGHLADELKRVIPEVEYAVQERPLDPQTLQSGDKIQKETGGYAGADFFKMFNYPLLEGNAQTALTSPESIAISRKMAMDFFGSAENAMGKTIRFENRTDFSVTAVFENQPENTSEKFDFLINWQTYLAENPGAGQWGNYNNYTFIQLRADASPAPVEKKITHFMDHYDAGQSASYKIELGIQPSSDIYLHSNFKNGRPDGGGIQYVY
jgi:putative ABC transport system permease protein